MTSLPLGYTLELELVPVFMIRISDVPDGALTASGAPPRFCLAVDEKLVLGQTRASFSARELELGVGVATAAAAAAALASLPNGSPGDR